MIGFRRIYNKTKEAVRSKVTHFQGTSHLQAVIQSTSVHDMYADRDEGVYQEEYLHWITGFIAECTENFTGTCLDLGCGQGRLTIPLAKKYPDGKFIGVDISEPATRSAKRYALNENVTNVVFEQGAILDYISSRESLFFDAIVMTEVTFFLPEWKHVVLEIMRTLKSGGLACVSFRPQYFNLLHVVRNRLWDKANLVLNERSGELFGNNLTFTWQTSDEIHDLLTKEYNALVRDIVGIGCFSGIEGDPHSFVARPSELTDTEKKQLLDIELHYAKKIPDTGRYMLALFQKQK